LRQLSRTSSYTSRIQNIQNINSLIVQSNEEEQHRFIQYRERLLNVGEILALTADILIEAASCENRHDLKPQDAIVFASIINHLQQNCSQQSCFLNRNSRDFDSPDIVDELKKFQCKMIPRFDHGYNFIQSQLSS